MPIRGFSCLHKLTVARLCDEKQLIISNDQNCTAGAVVAKLRSTDALLGVCHSAQNDRGGGGDFGRVSLVTQSTMV